MITEFQRCKKQARATSQTTPIYCTKLLFLQGLNWVFLVNATPSAINAQVVTEIT